MGKMLIFHGGGTEILVGNTFCTAQALKCLHFEYSERLLDNTYRNVKMFTESAMGGKTNPLEKVSTNLKQESK